MSLKVLITNNETGEVVIDVKEADVLIGAIHDDECIHGMCYTSANAFKICETIKGAESVSNELQMRNPTIAALLQLKDLFDMQSEVKEEEGGEA